MIYIEQKLLLIQIYTYINLQKVKLTIQICFQNAPNHMGKTVISNAAFYV